MCLQFNEISHGELFLSNVIVDSTRSGRFPLYLKSIKKPPDIPPYAESTVFKQNETFLGWFGELRVSKIIYFCSHIIDYLGDCP
jgi:hypothetical protein